MLVRVPAVAPELSPISYGLRQTCRSGDQVEEKTDPTIFIGWGDSKPVDDDTFSCTWTGQLQIPRAGHYTFFTLADDSMDLEIWDHGRNVLTLPSSGSSQGQVTLSAKTYQIKASYQNTGGAAGAYVYVLTGEETQKQALPPLWLRP